MKATYLRLIHPTVVIPESAQWGSQVLGAGSIVAVHPSIKKKSPITGLEDGETYVRWMDAAFKEHMGWIAEGTVWKRAASDKVARAPFHRREALCAWDHLRAKIFQPEHTPVLVPAAREWLVRHGGDHRAELIAVARQFGIRKSVAVACTTDELTCRVLALTLHRRYTMSTKTTDTNTIAAADIALGTEAKLARKAKAKSSKTSTKKTTGKEIVKAIIDKKKAVPAKAAVKKTAPPKEEAVERAPRGDAGEYKKTLGAECVKNLKAAGIKEGQDKAGLLRDGKKISTASMGELINACWAGKAKARAAKNEQVAVKLHSLARKVNLLRRKATAK